MTAEKKRKENGKIPICTPAMLALKRLRQEDGEFQRNVGTVTHCFPRAPRRRTQRTKA